MPLYNSQGQINTTSVAGSAFTGVYAADGSYNIVINNNSVFMGLYHPCGAYNAVVVTDPGAPFYSANGSMNVIANGASPSGYSPVIPGGNLGWVVNPSNQPDIMLDFNGNRAFLKSTGALSSAASLLSTVRSSTAYVNDSLGNWTSVGVNTPRITDLGILVEEARTNSIRNSSMTGAAVQADNVELISNGTFAAGSAGWTVSTAGGGSVNFTGGQVQILGDGTTTLNYISQQLNNLAIGRNYVVKIDNLPGTVQILVGTTVGGATTATGNIVGNSNVSASSDRITFTATATSHWVTLARTPASTLTVTLISVQDGERIQNGNFVASPVNASQSTLQNGWQWTNNTGTGAVTYNSGPQTVTIVGDGTNAAAFSTGTLNTVAGFVYTISFDVTNANSIGVLAGTAAFGGTLLSTSTAAAIGTYQYQFVATGVTSFVTFNKTSASGVTIDNISVKSAGKIPNQWAYQASLTGTIRSVSGLGVTAQGIEYIDLSFVGTTSASTALQINFDGNIAAVDSQVWGLSMWFQVLQDDPALASAWALSPWQYSTSNSVFVGTGSNVDALITSSRSTWRRVNGVATLLTGIDTIRPMLWNVATVPISTPINFSIRLGWPQAELGATVTAPIRTTAGSSTRGNEGVFLTTFVAPGNSCTLYAQGTPQAPNTGATNPQGMVSFSDNSSSNRISLRRAAATGGVVMITGGANQTANNAGTFNQGVLGKVVAAFAPGDERNSVNGTLATATTPTLPTGATYTKLWIGSDNGTGTGQAFNGFVTDVAVWYNQRLTDPVIQSLST